MIWSYESSKHLRWSPKTENFKAFFLSTTINWDSFSHEIQSPMFCFVIKSIYWCHKRVVKWFRLISLRNMDTISFSLCKNYLADAQMHDLCRGCITYSIIIIVMTVLKYTFIFGLVFDHCFQRRIWHCIP